MVLTWRASHTMSAPILFRAGGRRFDLGGGKSIPIVF
jgi:hypothetical protein